VDESLRATISACECVDVNHHVIVPNFGRGRVHIVPIAMSPIQEDILGTERATGCIRLLMSGMPTGTLGCTVTS